MILIPSFILLFLHSTEFCMPPWQQMNGLGDVTGCQENNPASLMINAFRLETSCKTYKYFVS